MSYARRTVMSATTKAIFLALLADAAVTTVVLALYGAGAEGAVVAARVTARVSAVVFSMALAMRTRASGPGAMRGFIAAHLTHYAAVAYLASVAVDHHLHRLTTRSVTATILGILLLVAIAFTTPAKTIWLGRVNAAAVYLTFATFLGGAILNGVGILGEAHRPALLALPALFVGLSWHLRNVMRAKSSSAVAATA